jgi:hypothetical protein
MKKVIALLMLVAVMSVGSVVGAAKPTFDGGTVGTQEHGSIWPF